jgi:hypothetical protein
VPDDRSAPADDDRVSLVDALQGQRRYVTSAGSPTAAQILLAVEDDLAIGGVLADRLPAEVRFGDLPGLRIMAAVHRLALERRAPAVAMRLPTLGGTAPGTAPEHAAFRRDVVAALTAHPEELAWSLAHTPQTNETGRARLLRCALSRVRASRVRLVEIGASAGLNLRADHLPGDPSLEAGPLPAVVERLGCDLDPVDITTPQGRTLLSSYVWVDDIERFRRLAEAMDVAARIPARLVQADAADFLAGLLPSVDAVTVIWHSAMWIYLPDETREAVRAAVARLGRTATPEAPVHHVSWEWDTTGSDRSGFLLVDRCWSGGLNDGSPRLIATGRSHGRDVALVAGEPMLERDPLVSVAG